MTVFVAFVAGAYLEYEKDVVSGAFRYARASLRGTLHTPEDFTASGDPGLVKFVEVPRGTREGLLPGDNGFEDWQRATREALRKRFGGPSADAPPPEVVELGAEELEGGIRRTLVTVAGFDGTPLPGYLLQPAGEGAHPGALVIPGHTGPLEQGISQTAGLVDSYQAAAALELARAGFVALTVELRGFGYLGSRAGFDHRVVAFNAVRGGSSYRGVLIRDLARALTFLSSRPDVDADRLIASGVSLGGELAWTLAAVDERIRAVSVHGYGGKTGPKRAARGPGKEDRPHGCHLIPAHNRLLVWEDWAYLVWPRALQVVRGSEEDSGDELGAILEQSWPKRAGAFDRPPGGHRFYPERAVEFLRANL